MSDDSQQLNAILQSFGSLLYHNVVTFSVGFTLYGVYLVVFPVSVWFTINRRPLARVSRILLAAMILAFAVTTVQFVVEMFWVLEQIRTYLLRTDIPLADRTEDWGRQFAALVVIDYWPQLVTYTISDAIVVWRAWVLYPRNRAVQGILATVTCADIILWIYAQVHLSEHAAQQGNTNPGIDVKLSTAANFMSLGTNLLATGFSRKYFQLMEGTWHDKIRRSRITRIMLVLIETGVAWGVIQIAVGVIQQLDLAELTSLDLATAVVETASTYLAGILPAVTVIIVHSQNSFESWALTRDIDLRTSRKISTLRFDVQEPRGSDSADSSAAAGNARTPPSKGADREKVGLDPSPV
ncbi:hypothetical protein FB451DRAFT_1419508 [Mycena latifolia]|nr:hypothetical protein FB451DRAFT_1419508 [Mycena latifolia]